MATYTYQDLYDAMNEGVHQKAANLVDARKLLNRVVTFVTGDVDLRSAKKKTAVSPNLFNDIYDYACPADMKGTAIADVIPQVNRKVDSEIILTSEDQFDRRKTMDKFLVAFAEDGMVRRIRMSFDIDDEEIVVSELDTLSSGGGTWAGFGDGTNLTQDDYNFVKGSGSINWDISAAGGTTAGIYNGALDTFDITDYLASGSAFVWVYITATANITNFIMRLGNDSLNYYSKTVTTDHASNAFVAGWNLLRFDLQSASQNGTVVPATCNYAAVYMTKAAGKISETDYRFDWIVLKRGKIHQISYYSKYGWQTNAGVWIEKSTATTDLLNVDADEFELMVTKAIEYASQALREYDDVKIAQAAYSNNGFTGVRDKYILKYPSEAKPMMTDY